MLSNMVSSLYNWFLKRDQGGGPFFGLGKEESQSVNTLSISVYCRIYRAYSYRNTLYQKTRIAMFRNIHYAFTKMD